MVDQADFRRDIRDALAHLYDTAHLECHPLAPQLLELGASSRLTRAQMLRRVLKEAIEALRPQQGARSSAPEWRSYLALHDRYVKGLSPLEIQDELGISRRQLQREERKGIDALVTMLWERRVADAGRMGLSTAEGSNEVQLLRQELERWEVSRQVCAVRALVEDTCWMLRPLMDRFEVTVDIALPNSLVPVFVDPTLTRQALFRIVRLLAEAARQGNVSLRATVQARTVDLVLEGARAIPHGEAMSVDPAAEDWEIASLLTDRQGGELACGPDRGDAVRVVMRLPLASRERVLVVDDVEAVHRLFERYLTPHNYEVVGASNGPDALGLAAELHPDLIILDVMMPTVDGWQVLRDLQDDEHTAPIPVVVCSVLDEPDLALSLGARAFIKKPVNRLELLDTLERLRSTTAPAAAAHPEAPADSEASPPS